MILITGATGNYGTQAINFLLKKGIQPNQISALARNKEKAKALQTKGINVKIGDYDNYDSLLEAFKGIDKLLFTSGSDIEKRDKQHQNVLHAAKEAGVNHIIYTSFVQKPETENSPIAFIQNTHINTENWLKENTITYTILRHALYLDLLPMFIGENLNETAVVMQPAGTGKTGSVLREELAEVAANVITTSGHENKIYTLTNTETFTYNDVVSQLSHLLGKAITYVSPSVDEFKSILASHSVPEEYIGIFAGFSAAQAKHEFDINDNDLETLLGRKPVSLNLFLSKVYA